MTTISDSYVKSAPSLQNALDIFKGEWSSKFPGDFAKLEAGHALLFDDPRLRWALDTLGGVSGKKVLELGPLEAGHTYMLLNLGAASVTAVEANTRAYLKCLITKEILKLNSANFLCGDFVEYLRNNQEQYGLCVASGVLYHMTSPVEVLSLIASCADQVYIWTHYYDEEIIKANGVLKGKFSQTKTADYKGFGHTLHRYEYLSSLEWSGFCGGSSEFSHWLSRADILKCLEYFGLNDIEVGYEEPEHPNGPSFALVAKRKA